MKRFAHLLALLPYTGVISAAGWKSLTKEITSRRVGSTSSVEKQQPVLRGHRSLLYKLLGDSRDLQNTCTISVEHDDDSQVEYYEYEFWYAMGMDGFVDENELEIVKSNLFSSAKDSVLWCYSQDSDNDGANRRLKSPLNAELTQNLERQARELRIISVGLGLLEDDTGYRCPMNLRSLIDNTNSTACRVSRGVIHIVAHEADKVEDVAKALRDGLKSAMSLNKVLTAFTPDVNFLRYLGDSQDEAFPPAEPGEDQYVSLPTVAEGGYDSNEVDVEELKKLDLSAVCTEYASYLSGGDALYSKLDFGNLSPTIAEIYMSPMYTRNISSNLAGLLSTIEIPDSQGGISEFIHTSDGFKLVDGNTSDDDSQRYIQLFIPAASGDSESSTKEEDDEIVSQSDSDGNHYVQVFIPTKGRDVADNLYNGTKADTTDELSKEGVVLLDLTEDDESGGEVVKWIQVFLPTVGRDIAKNMYNGSEYEVDADGKSVLSKQTLSTDQPSASPSKLVTAEPSPSPTLSPTLVPSDTPSLLPSSVPTPSPTSTPTNNPTNSPTIAPTTTPSDLPSLLPSAMPTTTPSATPTQSPTGTPTVSPTTTPSDLPSLLPSAMPTTTPTASPTNKPTESPSLLPTSSPSKQPTQEPSGIPTLFPTAQPTSTHSVNPSASPTTLLSDSPTSVSTNGSAVVLPWDFDLNVNGQVVNNESNGSKDKSMNMSSTVSPTASPLVKSTNISDTDWSEVYVDGLVISKIGENSDSNSSNVQASSSKGVYNTTDASTNSSASGEITSNSSAVNDSSNSTAGTNGSNSDGSNSDVDSDSETNDDAGRNASNVDTDDDASNSEGDADSDSDVDSDAGSGADSGADIDTDDDADDDDANNIDDGSNSTTYSDDNSNNDSKDKSIDLSSFTNASMSSQNSTENGAGVGTYVDSDADDGYKNKDANSDGTLDSLEGEGAASDTSVSDADIDESGATTSDSSATSRGISSSDVPSDAPSDAPSDMPSDLSSDSPTFVPPPLMDTDDDDDDPFLAIAWLLPLLLVLFCAALFITRKRKTSTAREVVGSPLAREMCFNETDFTPVDLSDPEGSFHEGSYHYTRDGTQYLSTTCEMCLETQKALAAVASDVTSQNDEDDDIEEAVSPTETVEDIEILAADSKNLSRRHTGVDVHRCSSAMCEHCTSLASRQVTFLPSMRSDIPRQFYEEEDLVKKKYNYSFRKGEGEV